MASILSQPLAPEIAQEVRSVIEKKAAPFTIERFEVRVDDDSDGEECIYVHVWHPLSPALVTARMMIDVQFAVRQHLFAKREPRFPHVFQHFTEGQPFATAA